MAAQHKTQCPNCGAQFRISEQHLAQAKGAVRCGSCLKVFQATEHLVDPPAAVPSKPAEPIEKWSLTEDPAKQEPEKPVVVTSSRWTMEDDLSDSLAGDMPDKLVDEPAPPALQTNDTKLSLGGLELSDSFMSLDGDGDDNLYEENFSDMAGAGKKTHSEDSDESWAEKLLEELEEEDKPAPAEVRADLMSLTERDEDQYRREEQEKKKQRTAQASQTSQEQPTDMPDWAMDSGDFFSDESLGVLNEDTDDLMAIDIPAIEERKTSRPSLPLDGNSVLGEDLLKWAALSLAALLVLASQYLIFNFQELSRTPAWQPFYTNVCGALGCRLPNPSDVTKLRGANLVVRAHPQVAEALVVDVIVFNESRYAQPFPLLELGFTSLNGRAIASRRFRPEEYLRGDLKSMTAMPPNVPIRLSLEILDPGSEAQNYTLRFFPIAR